MAKTPRDGAVRLAEGAEPLQGTTSTSGTSTSAAASGTTSGEHAKLDPVRCPHCGEPHPPTYSHCPRTGKPLQTGPALVGRVIAGRYRVTGILGEGGMGAVYIAEHLLLGRKVAIKRLHPELTGDEKAVARFQREARAAAQPDAPRWVALHAQGLAGQNLGRWPPRDDGGVGNEHGDCLT